MIIMALEDIMKISIINNKRFMTFFLGIVYSIVGVFSARLIFGSNPDMMSVAFVSILLIPAVNRILKVEEEIEILRKEINNIQDSNKEILRIIGRLEGKLSD